jgi:hypothetical protein
MGQHCSRHHRWRRPSPCCFRPYSWLPRFKALWDLALLLLFGLISLYPQHSCLEASALPFLCLYTLA